MHIRTFIAVLVSLTILAVPAVEAYAARKKKVKYVKSKYGVKALMELSKSMGATKKILKKETKNYESAVEAVKSGELKAGEDASRIRKSVGEPVVVLHDETSDTCEWVYKPSSATFFSKEKVYFIFDSNDKFIEWKIPE